VGFAASAEASPDPGNRVDHFRLTLALSPARWSRQLYWQRVKAVFGFSPSETARDLAAKSKSGETDADST
jgi:hypothetical protein